MKPAIHVYESKTAPTHRRFIAQFERIKNCFYITIHAPTAELAIKKANLLAEFQATDPKFRKEFDLKGKLSALELVEDEDDLL